MKRIAHFMDFEMETESVAFSPRFETEQLVERALDLLSRKADITAPFEILDIGTGCGNIAISLAKYLSWSRIVGLDISDGVLRIAKRNAARYNIEDKIEFLKSDVFQRIKRRYRDFFDLVISNPPYVSLKDFSSLGWEAKNDPYLALYGGKDGMDFYRKIVKDAHTYLKEGGILLMEIGYNQSSAVKDMIGASSFFRNIELYKDYSGIDRIVKAEKWTS